MQAMLPLIVVYRDKDKIDPYINSFTEENHVVKPDIFHIIPEKRVLHIDQIKELIKQISITSTRNRLFVLYDLDLAGPPAQNSLLKTLEEKKETDFFLIFATQLELIVTTIRSRCNVIYIDNESQRKISPEIKDFADLLLTQHSISALSHPLVMNMTLEKAIPFLDDLILVIHAHFSTKHGISFLKQVLKTKALIQSNNLNPQLAIDALLLKTKKYS
jgi:hypothetical protein